MKRRWVLREADAMNLPYTERSVDLVIGSPPYCDARNYGIGAQRTVRDWVQWMLEITAESLRVCDGAVIWVVSGVTRKRTYWPAVEGLAWRWFDEGWGEDGAGQHSDGSAYRPCFWHRVGIPGSGGDQWFRSDVETCLCFKRRGPLPWTDNTANGHPPKWAPGGQMSHRMKNGERLNMKTKMSLGGKRYTKTEPAGHKRVQVYLPPAKANPGNLIDGFPVGGGRMGHDLAHENEAPFPVKVPAWFIASLCEPDGIVLDPFCGSGTTGQAALELGRRFIGVDIRAGKGGLDTARRRLTEVERNISKA